MSARTRFLFLPARETIFALNIFPYPFLISFRRGNHIRCQYLPVPVFHFLPYGNPYPYFSLFSTGNSRHYNIPSRTFFISCRTGNHIRSQYLPVPVFHFFPKRKPYSLSLSSRTRFSFLAVRETIMRILILLYYSL